MPVMSIPALPGSSTRHPSCQQLKKENVLVHVGNPGFTVLLLLSESRFLVLAKMSFSAEKCGGGSCD